MNRYLRILLLFPPVVEGAIYAVILNDNREHWLYPQKIKIF